MSCLGGAAALAVGRWAITGLVSLWPQATVRMASIDFGWTILVCTFLLSVLTGALFGMAPARRAVKTDLVEALKEGGRTQSSPRRSGSLLVVAEVALGFVLVIGAGLMARTFVGLLRVDPGFDPARAVTFRVSLPGWRYRTPQAEFAFVKTLQQNITALPGVEAAGASSHVPFDESLPNWYSPYWPAGATDDQQKTLMADHRAVLPGYLPSLGATFVEGRNFEDSDDAAHRYVVVVDDWLARRTWPGQSAVGKKLSVETSTAGNYRFARDWAEVVGVVRHVQYHSLSDSVRPQIYLPFPIAVRPHMTFVVRTADGPEALVEPLRREVAKLDKDMPISNVRTLDDYVSAARGRARFLTTLAAILAGVALLLACVGIYGVASRSVLQRTTEIGIRAALGAKRAELLRMVVRQGVAPAVVGLLLGMALSLAVTPLLSALLFGVTPIDPVTIAAGAVLFLAVSLAACAIPAWRAVHVDPIAALRHT